MWHSRRRRARVATRSVGMRRSAWRELRWCHSGATCAMQQEASIGYSDRTCSEICLFSGAAGLLANASCLAFSAGLAVPSASPSAFADPSLSASAGSFGCEAETSGAFMNTGTCAGSGTLSCTASGALAAAGVLCLQQRAKRWQRPSAGQHDGTEPNASCRWVGLNRRCGPLHASQQFQWAASSGAKLERERCALDEDRPPACTR